MQIHSLPAGGAVGESEVSTVTLYTKQSSAHKRCFIRHYIQDENENDIHHFLKTVGFLQKYSDIKTPAPGFDFETCSAHIYSTKSKPFGKSICGGHF